MPEATPMPPLRPAGALFCSLLHTTRVRVVVSWDCRLALTAHLAGDSFGHPSTMKPVITSATSDQPHPGQPGSAPDGSAPPPAPDDLIDGRPQAAIFVRLRRRVGSATMREMPRRLHLADWARGHREKGRQRTAFGLYGLVVLFVIGGIAGCGSSKQRAQAVTSQTVGTTAPTTTEATPTATTTIAPPASTVARKPKPVKPYQHPASFYIDAHASVAPGHIWVTGTTNLP